MKNNIKKVKFLGRSVIFSAFYADICLCPKSVIITTIISVLCYTQRDSVGILVRLTGWSGPSRS